MNWQIAGHKQQLDFLENAFKQDRLAHGYLFAGPDGVGKFTVARKLAQLILCENNSACDDCGQCKFFLTEANADFLQIDGTEGIKIEQIRDLIYKLSLKPYMAKYKVAVIDKAEEMNDASANALLKSLEEPKSHTIIILVTPNANRLPATIVSRAQKINFGPVAFNEFESLLPKKLSSAQKEMIAQVASGKPGLALKISSDDALLEKFEEINSYYGKVFGQKLSDKLIAAAELADWETADLSQLFRMWLVRLETELREQPTSQKAHEVRMVAESFKHFDANANTKLLLANLMINLA
jgi:DNA polymerase III delta' subunit